MTAWMGVAALEDASDDEGANLVLVACADVASQQIHEVTEAEAQGLDPRPPSDDLAPALHQRHERRVSAALDGFGAGVRHCGPTAQRQLHRARVRLRLSPKESPRRLCYLSIRLSVVLGAVVSKILGRLVTHPSKRSERARSPRWPLPARSLSPASTASLQSMRLYRPTTTTSDLQLSTVRTSLAFNRAGQRSLGLQTLSTGCCCFDWSRPLRAPR
jgi:hypothetical protein